MTSRDESQESAVARTPRGAPRSSRRADMLPNGNGERDEEYTDGTHGDLLSRERDRC